MSDRPGQVYPDRYQAQLDAKVAQLKTEFQPFYSGDIDVYASPDAHFRMRAEFRVWHEGERSYFAMFDPENPREPIEVPSFPIGSETINRLMELLLVALHDAPELRYRLFQVEFLTTLSDEALVTLVYHRKLEDAWVSAAQDLAEQLGIQIIGRSRKQRIVLDRDYVTECLVVNGRKYHYRQIENSFTQPNAQVCEKMLEWALQQAEPLNGDLLELYCGLGTFTIPLAQQFDRVLATEISKTSVRAAEINLGLNGIENVVIGRMAAEDFSAGWRSGEGRRIKEYQLDRFNFTTVFVDPPRAGLDNDTVELVREFDHILYISCNPETLLANVQTLSDTHIVQRLALFDQFPYSHHREAGVLLSKRTEGV